MLRTTPAAIGIAASVAAAAPAAAPARTVSCSSSYAHAVACTVNDQRAAHGLSRLRLHGALGRAAGRHSADMVGRRYFSHRSPSGAGPADRARAAGYPRRRARWTVGEALAWGTGRLGSAQAIVRGWMASPAHRAVVLMRGADHVGVGAASGLPHGGGGVTVTLLVGSRG